jgi:hypothetical protein
MKQYFSFNPHSHDFWPLYEAINIYYPIGIRPCYERDLYYEYEGLKKLGDLLVDNIHNAENFNERFVSFSDQIQAQFGLHVQATADGQQPSFSFDLILEKTVIPGLTKIKKLCLAVSLLGDFYAIFGIDETIVIEDGDRFPRHAINAVIASPYNEFEQPYLELKKAVQKRYPEHRQVPFAILATYLNGLYSRYNETEECMIYNALFDQKLTTNYSYQKRGNQYYGYDEWLREGFDNTNISVQIDAP